MRLWAVNIEKGKKGAVLMTGNTNSVNQKPRK